MSAGPATGPVRILMVDDEPAILDGYRRVLGRIFQITACTDPREAIQKALPGVFDIVVSDLQMPGMDGITLLRQVRERAPGTELIMLTGRADVQAAIDCVNEGVIFRFLTKPCPAEALAKVITAAIEHARLVNAEKELLEKTLKGSVVVLTEILSLVSPIAFGRAARLRRYTQALAQTLKLENQWAFELMALLSQIGCVAIPTETLEHMHARKDVSDLDIETFARHPQLGKDLVSHIPRLADVGAMIAQQLKAYRSFPATDTGDRALGSQLLHAVLALDEGLSAGLSKDSLLARMRGQEGEFNPRILDAIAATTLAEAGQFRRVMVNVSDLRSGMTLDQDVINGDGVLLVACGHQVSNLLVERLRATAAKVGIQEPLWVLVPA